MREGWRYKKLGECFPFIKNGANIKQQKDAEGLPITRIETLSGGVFNRDRMGYASIYDASKYSDYILEDGDLLMSHINSKAYIGRTVEYKKEGNEVLIHGMNLLRLKADRTLILPSFMAYYTNSSIFKSDVARIRKDAVNQSSMAIGDLRKFEIPLPPKSQQEAIVTELDEINSLLALKREQLQKYDKLAQSLFYEMFGDPVENEKGWEVKKFIDVVKLQRGFDLPTNLRVSSGNIPVYGSNGVLGFHNESKIDSGIITGRSGTIGEVFVSHTPCWPLNTSLFSVDTHGNNLVYLQYLLRAYDLKRFVEGAGVPTLNRNVFHNNLIIDCPLPLQQQFASRIEQIESQKQQVQAAIEKLETLLASRMQYWFE